MTGDFILTHEVPTMSLKEGDIIAFQPCVPGSPKTLHRIVTLEKKSDKVITIETKGDHNNAKDPWKCDITTAKTPKLTKNVSLAPLNSLIPVKK